MQCDKIRDHFSDYLIERLTPGDQAALSQHVRECASCKVELEEWTNIWVKMGSLSPVGTGEPASPEMSARLRRAVKDYKKEWSLEAQAGRQRDKLWRYALVAAAAILVVVVSIAFLQRRTGPIAPGIIVDGSLDRTWGGQTDFLKAGDTVERGEGLHTDVAGAVLALPDGSRVEMRAQTELSLEHADDGIRIRLSQGGVIVNAAKQRTGHLYVQTKEITVSVVGTVFLVSAEEEGSSVAVIEGEVRVQQGTESKKLLGGEQVKTSPRLELLPMKEEISWSRNAEAHLALLQQAAGDVFEVVSIRPSAPAPSFPGERTGAPGLATCTDNGPLGIDSVMKIDPGRFVATRMNLYTLVAWAHGKNCGDSERADLISGGPGWIKSDRFEIQAVIPGGSPRYTAQQLLNGAAPKLESMLRAMLIDRFKLALHHDMRDVPVFALVLGKDGPKLRESRDGATKQNGIIGVPVQNGEMTLTWVARKVSMVEVVSGLAVSTGRPVLDRTGLVGEFSFDLKYGPDNSSIFRALEEQLGLRLDATNAPMQVLVIDHLEKPSEN